PVLSGLGGRRRVLGLQIAGVEACRLQWRPATCRRRLEMSAQKLPAGRFHLIRTPPTCRQGKTDLASPRNCSAQLVSVCAVRRTAAPTDRNPFEDPASSRAGNVRRTTSRDTACPGL